ncbi:phosphoesterase [Longimycelium tulufanense]|uniref:Phosphoesterase n=1 Tax=Longimycelium tulufanense TaxID=907463 RepID=A0A8J3CH50_9PSEU|nr:CehA/McbA family metallohydrolase [Longimycelium tulufanense]GGM65646.1 phosphoesterase [Longimycelium tulufanense]
MCGELSRRTMIAAGGAALAGVFLPKVAFADADGTRTIKGRFEPGAPDWHYLPFDVPVGTREIEVVYRYDRPEPPPGVPGNALDIGCFSSAGTDLGNRLGFRGWSGGFRDRFTISASEATPGYVPGPIEPGIWHVILGPYTVAPQGMNYEVEITLRPGPPGVPFVPRPAPERARGRGRAWYRGDCHLHTQHSDSHRWPADTAAAARAAGLDFIASTEHNTSTASLVWGDHAGPDLLVIDGEEVTTRSGHWLALGLPPGYWVDWRYRATEPQHFRRFAGDVHALGGMVVAAHPYCPYVGCPWEFGYDNVDGTEVWNGPWTLDDEKAVQTWDHLLRQGNWVPAIGNSDAHSEPQVVGLPQTAVLADDLSTPAVLAGLRAGRSWLAESSEVDLSLRATARGRRPAGIGEHLRCGPGQPVEVELELRGVPGCQARLLTPAGVTHTAEVPRSGDTIIGWTTRAKDSAWVRAEVRRPEPTDTTPDTMVALTNPIFLRG